MVICFVYCCIGCYEGAWILIRKVGENVGCASDQNCFLLKVDPLQIMIPGSARDVLMYILPQCFGPVKGRGWLVVFCINKSMVHRCGY